MTISGVSGNNTTFIITFPSTITSEHNKISANYFENYNHELYLLSQTHDSTYTQNCLHLTMQ